jgi:hypothetical protein
MSGAFSSQKQKTSSNSQQDPWDETIPYLQDYLGQLGGLDTSGLSADQTAALGSLKDIYSQGSPYSTQLNTLANDMATGPESQSGMIKDAYGALQGYLTPYAEGKFLDFKENPYVNDMLTNVGDSVQQRVNAMFAGAGRDLSGMNMKSVASGVTQAQLPILADLYSKEQDRALNAANTLYSGGLNAAQGIQGLDTSALQTRAGALPIMDASLQSQLWGPQGIFNTEQTASDAPFSELAQLGNLLLPVAQLGQQQQGTGKSSTTGFNIGAKLLSDERLKENIEPIGTMADGTPMVRFNYKGDPTVRIGVLAQDVEEMSPEAVTEMNAPRAGTEDGRVKYVDMDLATRRSADMMSANGPEAPMPAPNIPGEAGMLSGLLPPPMPRPMLDDELPQRNAA